MAGGAVGESLAGVVATRSRIAGVDVARVVGWASHRRVLAALPLDAGICRAGILVVAGEGLTGADPERAGRGDNALPGVAGRAVGERYLDALARVPIEHRLRAGVGRGAGGIGEPEDLAAAGAGGGEDHE
jgi:hypothetical protein